MPKKDHINNKEFREDGFKLLLSLGQDLISFTVRIVKVRVSWSVNLSFMIFFNTFMYTSSERSSFLDVSKLVLSSYLFLESNKYHPAI